MAISSGGSIGSVQSKTANQTVLTITLSAAVSVGQGIVLGIATDNSVTSNQYEPIASGIGDSGGNSWICQGGYAIAGGGSQSGAAVEVWTTVVTAAMAISDVIQISFQNTAQKDACAATAWKFNLTAGTAYLVNDGVGQLANSAADPGALDVTTISQEYLRVRMIAYEEATGTITPTSGWTAFTTNGTTGSTGATNMRVLGEFHISTGTGDSSNPTVGSADNASVYLPLREVNSRAFAIHTFDLSSTGVDLSSVTQVVLGGGWAEHGSYTTGQIVINNKNGARPNSDAPQYSAYYSVATPSGANYDIYAIMNVLSTATGTFRLIARVDTAANTMYQLIWTSSGNMTIGKLVAGSYADVVAATAITGGVTVGIHLVKFELRGTALKGYFDGTLVVSGTDSGISAAGKIGISGEVTTPSDSTHEYWETVWAETPPPTAYPKSLSVTRAPSQTLVRLEAHKRTRTVTRAPSPTLARRGVFSRPRSITRAPSPTVARNGAFKRAPTAVFTFTVDGIRPPTVVRRTGFNRTRTVTRAPSPTLARLEGWKRALSVTRAVTATVVRLLASKRTRTITRAPSPTVVRSGAFKRTAAITRAASMTLARVKSAPRSLSVTRAVTPAVTRILAALRTMTVSRAPDPLVDMVNPHGITWDSFTDTDGTLLESHGGEIRAVWTKHPSYASGEMVINDVNGLRANTAEPAFSLYYSSGVPATEDYDVFADFRFLTADTGTYRLVGRLDLASNTYYLLAWTGGAVMILGKLVAGSYTEIATPVAIPGGFTAGNLYRMRLELAGDEINGYVDGGLVVTATDSSISISGRGGVSGEVDVPDDATHGYFETFWMEGVAGGVDFPRDVSLTRGATQTVARRGAFNRSSSVTRAPSPTVARSGVFRRALAITRAVTTTLVRLLGSRRSLSITRAPSMTAARALILSRAVSITRAVSPVVARVGGHRRTLSATVAPSPLTTRRGVFNRAVSLLVAPDPALSRTGEAAIHLSITRGPSPTVARSVVLRRSSSLSIAPAPTLARSLVLRRTLTLTVSPSPLLARLGAFRRALALTRGVAPAVDSDITTGQTDYDRALSITIETTQDLVRLLGARRTRTVTRAPSPAVARAGAFKRARSVTRSVTMSVRRALVLSRALSVTRAVSQALARLKGNRRSLTVTRATSMALSRQTTLRRALVLVRGAVPTVSRRVAQTRAASTTRAPSPTLVRSVGRMRALAVTVSPAVALVLHSGLRRALSVVVPVVVSLVRRFRHVYVDGMMFDTQARDTELDVAVRDLEITVTLRDLDLDAQDRPVELEVESRP